SWMLIIPVGIIYFFLYYFAFSFLIKKFNFKTPGREDDDEETKLYTKADVNARKAGENGSDELSSTIARALGSKRNITSVDCCATRLRCSVADSSLVDQKLLKATGASGVIVKGTGVQVIYGPKVAVIKSNLEEYLVTAPEVEAGEEAPVVEEPAVQEETPVAVHGDHEFYAPVAGTAHAITEAPDAAFAGKMMGDGFFIAPADGTVVAPCDAEVMFVFDTKHAIGMKAADGTEFLIHFGVDTVKLGGQGFETFVEQGQQVKKGDKLMQVDLDYVKANAPSDVCLVIFTGGQAVHLEKSYGVKALDVVATY
ncbi:MAG: PTS glucose transporter subunit IIA, partial [Selenomonas sp.]|nr:PTS glucose transporter subunit IIA [Selenomonas sp.]